jgi:hypothetical protein
VYTSWSLGVGREAFIGPVLLCDSNCYGRTCIAVIPRRTLHERMLSLGSLRLSTACFIADSSPVLILMMFAVQHIAR